MTDDMTDSSSSADVADVSLETLDAAVASVAQAEAGSREAAAHLPEEVLAGREMTPSCWRRRMNRTTPPPDRPWS